MYKRQIERLRRCHASEIPEDYIDDYLAMSWLQWNGGALKLTELGENVRLQLVREL